MTLRVLFVCGADFRAPSEKQVLGFAERLLARGHEVMVSVGGDPETARNEGATGLDGLHVQRHRFRGRRLSRSSLAGAREFRPDVVHAFNSRHAVIAAAAGYSRAVGAPVCVHFEDDEWGLAAGRNEPATRRAVLAARRLAGLVNPPSWRHSSARSLRWVAREAAGVDALFPALAEHVAHQLGRDCVTIFPLLPSLEEHGAPDARPARLPAEPLVMLAGAIWDAQVGDARRLMRAVALVRRRGVGAHFVHVGSVAPRFQVERMAQEEGLEADGATFLGYLPLGGVPAVLARASVLVQPGEPSEFNRLRLPSKLQLYLPSGVPTVTFAAGFGELLEDRRDVLKTYTGDPSELADRIEELLLKPELGATLGRHGPEAAARLFDPKGNTDALVEYYRAALASSAVEAP